MADYENLASYRRCVKRIREQWPTFQQRRADRLQQQERFGSAAEKVAENILEDLFTDVIDWPLADFNNQVDYADIELTSHGIKYLLIEVKRPGALAWNRRAVARALEQARRYADQQRVKCIAVSDGVMLYAADIDAGGLKDRLYMALTGDEPPLDLWWLSVQGIYRTRTDLTPAGPSLLPDEPPHSAGETLTTADHLVHPKYNLPARCFAYVGHGDKPSTWKLPYLLADGNVDEKRLPKAIQAILTNYRGARIDQGSVPEKDIPAVLHRLAEAAARIGRLPVVTGTTAPVYQLLAETLAQFER